MSDEQNTLICNSCGVKLDFNRDSGVILPGYQVFVMLKSIDPGRPHCIAVTVKHSKGCDFSYCLACGKAGRVPFLDLSSFEALLSEKDRLASMPAEDTVSARAIVDRFRIH